jgi:phosphoribosylanthranilate isomerase
MEIIAITNLDGSIKVRGLTKHEKIVVDSLIETGSPAETAVITNSPADEIQRLANDVDIQLHIDNIRMRTAKAKSLDDTRVKAAVSDALSQAERRMSKAEDLTRNDVSVLNLSAEVTGIKKTNLDIKLSGRLENPYKDFSDEELEKLIADRLQVIENKKK